jgi:hypothetical protein
MSKALVIKGANFSQNKVGTISFTEVISCTGISLSENAIEFTQLNSTQQLTATVTPVDTTDSIVWASSNENCVTVENGLVRCVGVGSATITAMCGTQSASCTVTVSVSLDMSTIDVVVHKGLTSTDLSLDPPKDYFSVYGTESGEYLKKLTFLSNVPTSSGYKCLTGDYPNLYPIMLPANTQRITVKIPNSLSFNGDGCYIQFADSTMLATYNVAKKGVLAKTGYIKLKDYIVNKQFNYDVPDVSGIDSFAFLINFTTEINEKPDGMEIIFS